MVTEVGMLEISQHVKEFLFKNYRGGENLLEFQYHMSLFAIMQKLAEQSWKPSFSEDGPGNIKRYYFWREF